MPKHDIPNERRYTATHEWIRRDGEMLSVGITPFFRDDLARILAVELPEIGRKVETGESLALIETSKTANDVYAPFAGTVLAVNRILEEEPILLHRDPWHAWIAVLRPEGILPDGTHLDATRYREHLQ